MIKKLLAAFTLAVSIGSAFAAVDINSANSDALRGIKGIGPAKAKAILDEREAKWMLLRQRKDVLALTFSPA